MIDITLNKLEETIQILEFEFTNILTDAPRIISRLESGFDELKSIMSDYVFKDISDEIIFFKIKKPRLFNKLIYYQKIYHIELKRPITGYQCQRTYLERELEQINVFYNKNADFIQYYRSGKTLMDEYYFLRGRKEIDLNLESFYFERDPKFSTAFDFKVSKLIANDRLAAFINSELAKLKRQEEELEPYAVINSQSWTDKKTAIVELIYAIHSERSINSGNISLKLLAALFSRTFKINLDDLYNIFLEIRSRKNHRTEYLDRLVTALTRRMDEADNK
ncbi:RteC protein [Porphyromonadaceae bacterium KH3CP3RA]|nr:RteC protein [Porphyromonadaceae bacterium KH3CP3RA]